LLKCIWNYRHFIIATIEGELLGRGRFARSRLWGTVVYPSRRGLGAGIFHRPVGGHQGEDGEPCCLSTLSGMAVWGLVNEIMMRRMNVFLEQAAALERVSFPQLEER
jgi:lipopolysaccharide transport system permease protein